MPEGLTKGAAFAGRFIASDGFATSGVREHWKRIDIRETPTGSEQDTGYDLPVYAEVLETRVLVEIGEATGATKTLDVGLKSSESGGDADGFIDGISVASLGPQRPAALLIDGATEEYFGSTTIGALMAPLFTAGSNSAGDVGTNYERPFLTSSVTAKSISYTAGSSDWAEFRGAILLHIREYD